MKSPAAFFDLDLTMIDCNSAVLWAQHDRETGFITRSQWLRAMVWSGLYWLSLIDMERAYGQAVGIYRGLHRDEIDTRTRDWFIQHVAPRTRPGALDALSRHRAEGHRLILLTSSTSFQANAAAEHWGFDDYLANTFQSDEDGRMLGTVNSPICYKDGKVYYAEAYAAEHGIDLDKSWFYSDSYSDLPMLERVGNPRVIAPDPRLRIAAKRRNWVVETW